MQIHIEGRNLPGRCCLARGDFPGYREIHVGIQRRNRPTELLGLAPGDAGSVTWVIEAAVTISGATPDLRGPYIQGGPGQRFIYLSWVTMGPGTGFNMFRRAKLMLSDLDPETLAAAERAGRLNARVVLSDEHGTPVCGRVRPPAVEWSAP